MAYVLFSLLIYLRWVAPSLDGRTDQHIAADSTTYIYFADALREGRPDPVVAAGLSSYPNTLWCPVLMAFLIKSTFSMVIANYAIFFLAIILLRKSIRFSSFGFMGFMFLNATTTISLLAVNKEIIDLLVVALFFFGLRKRYFSITAFAIALALFNRYEICIALCLFLLLTSGANPWRQKRAIMLALLVVVMSVCLPLFASKILSTRFEEVTQGHTVVVLDFLEMHYLYAVAVIPKITQIMFAELVNFQKLPAYFEFSDIANTYIVFLNNLASLIVLCVLIKKRKFSLGNDLIYLAMIGWVVMAIAVVIQPRYFYFSYCLLCLSASQTVARSSGEATNREVQSLVPTQKEAAVG